MRRLILLPLFALTAVACAPPEEMAEPGEEAAATTEADVEAIQAHYAAYGQAITSGDTEAWLAIFTDDVVVMPPGAAGITGKEVLRAWGQPYFDQFDMRATVSTREIQVAGEWAFAVEEYTWQATPKEGGEAAEERGKGIAVLRRQPEGTWTIAYRAWNRDHPLPGGE
jgi:uncharacterized protein (TIGR02246 family)